MYPRLSIRFRIGSQNVMCAIYRWKMKLICLYIDIFSNALRIMISRPESGKNYILNLETVCFLRWLNLQREPEIRVMRFSTKVSLSKGDVFVNLRPPTTLPLSLYSVYLSLKLIEFHRTVCLLKLVAASDDRIFRRKHGSSKGV